MVNWKKEEGRRENEIDWKLDILVVGTFIGVWYWTALGG